mgnify:CR=1 FL=1
MPSYVKEYEARWRQYDRFLRVRRSEDEYGKLLLERKTRYIAFPDERPASPDRRRQLTDGYRLVFSFWPNEIRFVEPTLRLCDVQRQGAAELAADLENQERLNQDRIDRETRSVFEAIASEHYDHLAWAEGRRVAT